MERYFQPLPKWVPGLLLACASIFIFLTWQSLSEDRDLALIAALIMLTFGFMDGMLLAALPRLKLSYGSLGFFSVFLLFSRVILFLLILLTLAGLFGLQPAWHSRQVVAGAIILWGIANLAISAVSFYGL